MTLADEEPTAEEIRDRAEKARARRAAERAARKADEAKVEEKAESKKKRRWWNWVIDAALIGASVYLIKARFFSKEEQPAPSPKPSVTAAAASASLAPAVSLKAGTELRGGAGPMFASVETIATPTTFETLEAPAAGWVKVKVPSGKIGWVPVDAIGGAAVAPAPSTSAVATPSASASTSASH